MFNLSLRAKIIALLTLLFVILTSLAIVEQIRNFDRIREETQSEYLWISRWIRAEQHRHIAQARQVVFLAINEIRKGTINKFCSKGFLGAPGLDTEYGQFAIADPQGNVSCNSIPWLKNKNVAGKEYFQQALQLVDVGVIDEADNQNPHQYAAIKSRAMRDKDGHVLKVILVAMDFSWVREEIEASHLPPNAHLMIIDAKGTLIAGSDNMEQWVDKSIADTPFYKNLKSSKDVVDGVGFGGAKSLIITSPINTESGYLSVIIDIPEAEILKPAYQKIILNLLSSILAFVLILALAYYWSNKYFLRKVMAIDHASRRLAGGDLSARTGIVGTNELAHLANSFDFMADALQKKTSQLIEKDSQLEATNDELFRVNRALQVLSAGNKALLFAQSEQELLANICHDIVEKGGYIAAWIGFTGPGHDRYLREVASYSKLEDQAHKIDWNKAGNEEDPIISTVQEDKVLVINDTSQEAAHPHLGSHAAKFGYKSIIALPLHLVGKPFGVLIIAAYRVHEFGPVQVEYLKETAQDTSFGIEMLRTKGEKNRLELAGVHHEAMLRNSLEDALHAISLTIEMRDPYTAGHQHRVANLAKELAKNLGMTEDETHGIYLAAIVHDIGKINVPADILVKPGKLNEMEYALVRLHVVAGYEILKGIKFPWPIADMVHQHHERIDGSGYPLGLKDGEILFGARILAVADVVEAMVSHRPYRPGLGQETALGEIEKGKGKLFDATVVDACLKLFREGKFMF